MGRELRACPLLLSTGGGASEWLSTGCEEVLWMSERNVPEGGRRALASLDFRAETPPARSFGWQFVALVS